MSGNKGGHLRNAVLLIDTHKSNTPDHDPNKLNNISEHINIDLRTLIRRMNEPVMLIGQDFRVIEINDAALEAMGYPPGTTSLMLTSDLDLGQVTDQHGRAITWEESAHVRSLRGEDVVDLIQVHHRKDGSRRYYIVNGYPIRDETGNVVMALVIGRDVTSIAERLTRAEEILQSIIRKEKTLRAVLDNLPAAVVVLDSNLRLLSWNTIFAQRNASVRTLRVGTRFERVVPRAHENGIISLLRKALELGQPVRFQELHYETYDGEVTYWTGSVVPIELELDSGPVCALAIVAVDVTEQVLARKRTAELAAIAEQRAAEVETERARLNTIIESAPVPLCVLDNKGRTVIYNSAQAKLFESFGIDFQLLNNPDTNYTPKLNMLDAEGRQIDDENSPAKRALRGETCREMLISILEGSQSPRSFKINAAPLRDTSGEIVGVVQASLEVTDLVRAHQHIQDMYRREHAVAEKLQESFLVREYPEIKGFERAALYRAAVHADLVGGDFHDLFYLNDGRVGIVIGDVAGKGLKAAVYTAMTKYMLRAYAFEDPKPDLVLARLNEALSACTPTEVFVTLVYAVLNIETGGVIYANAGHEPPVWISQQECIVSTLDVTGRALALTHGSVYNSRTFDLSPGDLIVFFTDGITDAGINDNRLGPERAIEVLKKSASGSALFVAEALMNAAVDFANGNLADDAAVLVVRRLKEKER